MGKTKLIVNRLFIYILISVLMISILPVRNIEAAATPSTLKLTVVDVRQIKLNWDDTLTNEAGYKIDRKTDSGVFVEVGTAWANSKVWNDYNVTSGVTYTYRVRSYDASGNSTIHTDEVSTTTTSIDRPATLTITPVSSTQIDLTWTYPGSKNFDTVIERSLTGGTNSEWTTLATIVAGTNTYSDKNLGTNIQYHYRIKALNNSNIYSAYCPFEFGISAFTKLDAPTNLYGYAASSTQIFLSWVDNSNKTLYFDIERKEQGSENFTVVGSVFPGVSTWVDSGLTTNNGYTYRVRARSIASMPIQNYSNYTDEITIKCVHLSEPTNLTAMSGAASKIKLDWKDNSSSETEFEIWRKAGQDAKWEQYASVDRNVTSYTDDNISADISYSYKVRGHLLYNDAYSAFTNEATVWTIGLRSPTDLQASKVTNTELKLTWEDNSKNEAGFTIERKTGIEGEWQEIASLPSNTSSYNDKNVSTGILYFYRVKVYENIYYRSYAYSTEILASTQLPAAPSNVSAEAVSSNNVKLSWKDNSLGEIGFKIERSVNSSLFYEEISQLEPNTTTFLDTELSPNTKYYYRVRAYSSSGDSSYSTEVYVKTYARVSFKDISDTYWAKYEIENLASRRILKKKSNGYFGPNDKITRGELAYVLVKAFKLNKTAVGSLADVSSKHTYYKEIMIAEKMGIITKNKRNYFYPNRVVTRQDMAVFVARALKAVDKPLREYDLSILNGFSDKKYVSAANIQSVATMFGEAIMVGKTKSGRKVIAPLDSVLRADMAVVIYKVIDR